MSCERGCCQQSWERFLFTPGAGLDELTIRFNVTTGILKCTESTVLYEGFPELSGMENAQLEII
jgi:hypothetical protein